MHLCRVALLAFGAAAGLTVDRAVAESQPDPDLPQPLDLSVATALVEKSPFTRPLNLADKLQLTGIAYVEGKPVATLLDRETKKNYVVSETPNAQGWKLADASASSALRQTSVKLQVGTEVVTIHYGDAQLVPTSTGSGRVGPSVWPSDQEAIRTGEDGKPYVRSSAYLSDADKERYYRGWSRESHEKYRGIVMENREMMLKASPQQRAEFAKKTFDQVDSEERARGNTGTSGGSPYFRGPPPGSGGPFGPRTGDGSSFRGGDGSSFRGGDGSSRVRGP
jgi:hypothetical protein